MMRRWDASIQRVIAPANTADNHYSNKQHDSLSKTAQKKIILQEEMCLQKRKQNSFKNMARACLKRNLD